MKVIDATAIIDKVANGETLTDEEQAIYDDMDFDNVEVSIGIGGNTTPLIKIKDGEVIDEMNKWHYVCEHGITGKCDKKCEMFTSRTIHHEKGCPDSEYGSKADWNNLGLKTSPYDQIPDDSVSENEKCSLKWCKSGLDGTVRVNENIGDGCFRTDICEVCLKLLGLKEGMDLPDPSIVEEKLTSNPSEQMKADNNQEK